MSNAINLIDTARECGLAENDPLILAFSPFYERAMPLVVEAATVNVTALDQVTEMKKSRDLRLKLRPVRIEADKLRKEMKEESLRTSSNIEKVAQVIIKSIAAEEERLEQQEKYAVRAEAERKARVQRDRATLLIPFGVDPSFYQLGDMPPEQFAQLLDSSRLSHESKIAAAKKAEDDRIAAEAKRAEEDKRIREENARLMRERAEQEEAARREREAAEAALAEERRKASEQARVADEKARRERDELAAKAKAEREAAEADARREYAARMKLETEKKEREAAEKRAAAEAERVRKEAEAAPDREKLLAYADAIWAVPVPSISNTVISKTLDADTKRLVEKIRKAAKSLGTEQETLI